MNDVFSPIRPTRASTEVIAQIRKAIFAGRYQPGDRLPPERQMAHQFAVSRVTVRDALRALEAGGLIEVRVGGQGGPYVSRPNVSQLSASLGTHLLLQGITFGELAEARLALETTAARLAAQKATSEDLVKLQDSIESRNASTAHGTADTSVDFHYALVSAAHNRALLALFMATTGLLRDAFYELHAEQPDMVESARITHRLLYEVIARRDGDEAVRLMRDHLYEFAERAERANSKKAPRARRVSEPAS